MQNVKYKGFKDLIVYQKARTLAFAIFNVTKTFPKEERFALTDQVRRSSRAIGANIAEAWPKRKYPKAFVSKLIDAQSESCETVHWLEVAAECNYMENKLLDELCELLSEIQRMIESMVKSPEKFCK